VKRGPQARQKKTLSAAGLLEVVRKRFETLSTSIKDRKIRLADCLMSALAMFSLKSPSLLAFDQSQADPTVEHNLKTLFGIQNVPCDTYMRQILDEVNPEKLRTSFLSVFHEAQKGKLLERYQFLEGYLCLVDGSQIFHSEKIHCKNCCQKKHQDGRTTYHHQILGAVLDGGNG
jgi:hypothetical protein